jgi:Epoxide hydrolase N terminus
VAIPDAQLDDPHDRLRRIRFPAPLPGDGWDTGVPVSYLKELVTYWDRAYDWRAAETRTEPAAAIHNRDRRYDHPLPALAFTRA